MKELFLILFFLPLFIQSQTLLEFDRMESSSTLYLSAGWFTPASTASWFTNASVTPTQSAAIYGINNTPTNLNEQDWYSMPNKTGLDANKQYQLKFKLASYTFSNSTATTKGVDVADIVEVQLSTNGGVSYVSELRITGNSNAQWTYGATGTINHTANGSFTNSAAPTGDVYQAPAGVTTTAPSTINLNLPTGITQIAIDIFCRVNAAGEEWWIDNIELWDITPIPLPVELTYFDGSVYSSYNVINWSTASEYNSDYFELERSVDGNNWTTVFKTNAAGNSIVTINYKYLDFFENLDIHYYRLNQVDYDGKNKIYGPISLDNRKPLKKIIKYINSIGQEVNSNTKGLIFEVYEDGTMKKIIN
jgi:hypothetical protein